MLACLKELTMNISCGFNIFSTPSFNSCGSSQGTAEAVYKAIFNREI